MEKKIIALFFKTEVERNEFWNKAKDVARVTHTYAVTDYHIIETIDKRIKLCLFHSFYTCGLSPDKIIFYNCSLHDCDNEEVKLYLKMFEDKIQELEKCFGGFLLLCYF